MDLSLHKSVSNGGCFSNGVSRTFTLTAINNDDNFLGTGVSVINALPSGTVFTGSSGYGAYDAGTGVWTIGTILPGQTVARNIEVTMSGTLPVTNNPSFGTLFQIDPDVSNNSSSITLFACGPTSANVSVSGRVLTPDGRGIRSAVIQLWGGDLTQPVMAVTTPSGHYSFKSVTAGRTYFISVQAKGYVFADPMRSIFLVDDATGIDFISNM